MRKFFVIFTPIAIVAITALIMLSGEFLKKPTGDMDNVPKYMDTITKAVQSEDWKSAEENASKLEDAWKIIVKRVQFSGERNEINDLNVSIARIKASINVQDKSAALMELSEAGQHWIGLGR